MERHVMSRDSEMDPNGVLDRDRCDPELSGSADGGGGAGEYRVGRPDKTVTRASRRRIQNGVDDQAWCDPEPSGSADGEIPVKVLRAVTTIPNDPLLRYGGNVAADPNESRFGVDRAAPLQGADSRWPSRSEQIIVYPRIAHRGNLTGTEGDPWDRKWT